MTFRTLTITTHPSTASPVIIPDMGFDVPGAAAGTVSISDPSVLDRAASSNSLRTLATDAAFPSGFGTISLDDGGRTIPPILASARLDALTRFNEDWIVVISGPEVIIGGDTIVTAGGPAEFGSATLVITAGGEVVAATGP